MNKIQSASTLVSVIAVLTACSAEIDDSDNLTVDEVFAAEQYLQEEKLYLDDELDEEEDDIEIEVVANNETFAIATALPINPANASRGVISNQFNWPIYAIHSALLPSGKVISYGSYPTIRDSGKIFAQPSAGYRYDIWTPSLGTGTNSHTTLDTETNTNVFCSAQTLINTGALLITGGDGLTFDSAGNPGGGKNDGISKAQLYVDGGTMSLTGSMAYKRWYPTLVPLSNGEVLVHGGRIYKNGKGASDDTIATTPEIFNPVSGRFRPLPGAEKPDIYDADTRGWYYPRSWLDTDGNVLFFKSNSDGFYTLNPNGNGSINRNNRSKFGKFSHVFPSVRYDSDKILTIRAGRVATSINLKPNARGNIKEKRLASIPSERYWSDATVLADGKVLISGGSAKRQKLQHAVLDMEIYDPSSNSWSKGPKANSARLYHSSAILLQNGAVLMAGGGPPGPVANLTGEIYYPPYLFDRTGNLATRPGLTSVKTAYSTGEKARLTFDAPVVTRVGLVRLGSTTHSYDMGQSYYNLKWSFKNGTLTVNLPKNSKLAAPGYYMLFAFDGNGVPSEGQIFTMR